MLADAHDDASADRGRRLVVAAAARHDHRAVGVGGHGQAHRAEQRFGDAAGVPRNRTSRAGDDCRAGARSRAPLDDAVIAFAVEAAARRAARLRVVHGASLPPCFAHGLAADPALGGEPARQEESAVETVPASWREKFPDVEVVEQAVVGNAAGHLVDASADASLVVVGRRIRRTPLGARIGPVTRAVPHHATAPVAVVPHH